MSRRARFHRARRTMREVVRPSLPHGIFRWEIYLDCNGPYHCMTDQMAEEAVDLYEFLKSSAAGRWKAIRRERRRYITKIFLERDSDAVLVKLRHLEMIYKVFRIVLPGETRTP